jgi:hypothetical protein
MEAFKMADLLVNNRAELIKEYFRRMDAGSPDILELVTDDAEIGFPKFGIGRGKDSFREMWSGFSNIVEFKHVLKNTICAGDFVVVEGFTNGRGTDGRTWTGGSTPGGRFCNVFEFRGDLIARVHVYLDPDYFGDDKARFRWGHEGRIW